MTSTSTQFTAFSPPHDEEAERAVLGGILLADAWLGRVQAAGLRRDHFYRPKHRHAFDALCELEESGKAIDPLTLAAHLEGTGRLEDAGGRDYVTACLAINLPNIAHTIDYARILIERAEDRRFAPLAVDGGRLVATPLAQIKAEPVTWLWRGWVPLGHLTVLLGDPKLGKSTLAFQLAADVSRGHAEGDLSAPADALIVTFEDHIAQTVKPRILAAGGDSTRIHELAAPALETPLVLPGDVDEIVSLAESLSARLIIIDPLSAALGSEIDSHKDASVRRALAPLAAAAERHDLAIVVIAHNNKSGGTDMVQRAGGSIGITAAARSILLFARDPNEPDPESSPNRVLQQRGNLAPASEALTFRIEGDNVRDGGELIETSKLIPTGSVNLSPADLLAMSDRDEHDERLDAADWLIDRLSPAGSRHRSADVKREATKAGHSERTLKRAFRSLDGESVREGFPAVTFWVLPESSIAVGPNLSEATGPTEVGPTGQTRMDTEVSPPSGTQLGQTPDTGPTAADEAELLREAEDLAERHPDLADES